MARDTYESPLSSRYADKEMKYLFSPDMKFRNMGTLFSMSGLWVFSAEIEKKNVSCQI